MLNIYFRIVLQSTGFTTADTQVPGYLPYEKLYNWTTYFGIWKRFIIESLILTFDKFYILPLLDIKKNEQKECLYVKVNYVTFL